MGKQLSHEEFLDKIKLDMNEYKILSNYISSKKEIRILHLNCNTEYSTIAERITRKKPSKCPTCFKSNKKNMTILQSEIDDIFGKNIYEVDKNINYTGNKMDINVKCNNCKETFTTKPYRITSNRNGCPFCSKSGGKISFKLYKSRLDKLFGEGKIIINSDKITFNKEINITVVDCNHTFDIIPSNLLNMKKCKECNKRYNKTTKRFYDEVKNISDQFELVSEYVTPSKGKVSIRHNQCNSVFEINADDFLSRKNCTVCSNKQSESISESLINKILSDDNIVYSREKKFDNLTGIKNNLRIDFYIPKENLSIEYDGEFHFNNYFGDERLIRQQENDLTKNIYMYNNKIKMIRIPYKYSKNLEDIIKNRNDFDFLKNAYPLILVIDYNIPKSPLGLINETKSYARLDMN